MWLNGGIRCISSYRNFREGTQHQLTARWKVGIDDACIFIAIWKWSLGVWINPVRTWNKPCILWNHGAMPLFVGICMTEPARIFDNADDSTLRGWRSIMLTDGDQPYMDKCGCRIGYRLEHPLFTGSIFFKKSGNGEPCKPTLRIPETQKVCEAVIDSANSSPGKTQASLTDSVNALL